MKIFLLVLTLFASAGCALDLQGTGPVPTGDGGAPAKGDSESVAPTPLLVPVCHPLTTTNIGNGAPAPSLCKSIEIDSAPSGSASYYEAAGGACTLHTAPDACSGCDYTCACFLATFGSACSCVQDSPGAVIAVGCP